MFGLVAQYAASSEDTGPDGSIGNVELNTTIAAEVYPFQKFWIGEEYHQNYEKLHPNNSYIRNVSIPRLKRFQAKMPNVLKARH